MQKLSGSALLSLWERGMHQHPLERPLTILFAANPGRDPEQLRALSVGRRDEELLRLRDQTFGGRISGVVDCPSCAEALELSFDTAELAPPPVDGRHAQHSLAVGQQLVVFRLPTAADVAALAGEADVDRAMFALLERCVASPPLCDLSEAARRAVSERMAELDPLADLEIAVVCPTCGHAAAACFDIASFLWIEIDSAARRTLEHVHALASAYGWREADVLELSPVRRRLYLELSS
jgi:hypothetical protein